MTKSSKEDYANATKLAIELKALANKIELNRRTAAKERKKCDAIQRNLLNQNEYTNQHDGSRITEPRLTYCMTDEQSKIYFDLLDRAYFDAGYRMQEAGQCPALVAEHEVRKLEWALLERSTEIMMGKATEIYNMETRKGWIDSVVGLVKSHPVNQAA